MWPPSSAWQRGWTRPRRPAKPRCRFTAVTGGNCPTGGCVISSSENENPMAGNESRCCHPTAPLGCDIHGFRRRPPAEDRQDLLAVAGQLGLADAVHQGELRQGG